MSAANSSLLTSAENVNEKESSYTPKMEDIKIPSLDNIQIIHMDDFQITREQKIQIEKSFIPQKYKFPVKCIKIAILVGVWAGCSYSLITREENMEEYHQISVPRENETDLGYVLPQLPDHCKVWLKLQGALLPPYYSNLSKHYVYIWMEHLELLEPLSSYIEINDTDIVAVKNISVMWRVPVIPNLYNRSVPEVKRQYEFDLENFTVKDNSAIRIKLHTNLRSINLPLLLTYNLDPINLDNGVIYAALVLIGLYVLIIFEILNRTLAAMLASTLSIAILAVLNARPTMAEIVSWIDIETLLLLFSMMILVSIISDTGFFDYLAVLAYKTTNGKEWQLINALCGLTALLSCFLDNVTTALLMTPTTIRLCEVTMMDPVPVLICMVIYSNIGGAITPIGDPPNVIIASNPDVIKSGISFISFSVHMGVGVILASIAVHLQLIYMYKNMKKARDSEPQEVLELKREIAVWQRTAACMSSYSKDEESVKETIKKTSTDLLGKLISKTHYATNSGENYGNNLEDLQKRYRIKDKVLLIKSTVTLGFVILLFCLHSNPNIVRLGLGWTALLGALLLLILYDRDDIESVFARVEWSTLLFFGALFVLMEALAKLGLIDWIGTQTKYVIMSVNNQESRIAVAILLILWISALVSSFVDNIPLTTMMIKVCTVLASNAELGLPLQPLVWALSFGACFGGNGTLFGSSSNIVCAGVAEQHGYKLSFIQYMKIGFPIMITSLLVISVYLMIVHVALHWH